MKLDIRLHDYMEAYIYLGTGSNLYYTDINSPMATRKSKENEPKPSIANCNGTMIPGEMEHRKQD